MDIYLIPHVIYSFFGASESFYTASIVLTLAIAALASWMSVAVYGSTIPGAVKTVGSCLVLSIMFAIIFGSLYTVFDGVMSDRILSALKGTALFSFATTALIAVTHVCFFLVEIIVYLIITLIEASTSRRQQ